MCSPGLGRNVGACYGPYRWARLTSENSEAYNVSMMVKDRSSEPDSSRHLPPHSYGSPPRVKDGVGVVLTLSPGDIIEGGLGPGGYHENGKIHLSAKDVNRWRLATLALHQLGVTLETFKFAKHRALNPSAWTLRAVVVDHFREEFGIEPMVFLQPSASDIDWRLDTNVLHLIGGLSVMLIPIFLILAGAYGGIHLAAWHFVFPTKTESILWRIASMESTTGSLVMPVLLLMFLMDDGINPKATKEDPFWTKIWASGWAFFRSFSWLLHEINEEVEPPRFPILRFVFPLILKMASFIAVLNAPVFIAMRIYLVIESFISVRHVPAGCYVTIPWAQYIPHL